MVSDMNQTLIYNSDFKTLEGGVSPFSRAFLYGESVFATMRVSEGKVLFLESHLYRLELGYHWLFDTEILFPKEELAKGLTEIASRHSEARIRVTFHLNNDQYEFVPTKENPEFIVMVTNLEDEFLSDVPEVRLGICDEPYVRGVPHFAKVGSYLHQVRKLKEFRERNYDDVLFLDDHRRLTEASTSNIFFRKDDLFMTPSLSEGLLDGVMRKNINRYFKEAGWKFTEGHFDIYNLLESDEVWLTNSSGIRVVTKIDREDFSRSDWTDKLKELVLEGIKNDQNS